MCEIGTTWVVLSACDSTWLNGQSPVECRVYVSSADQSLRVEESNLQKERGTARRAQDRGLLGKGKSNQQSSSEK